MSTTPRTERASSDFRAAREAAGLSRPQVADFIGCSDTRIKHIEAETERTGAFLGIFEHKGFRDAYVARLEAREPKPDLSGSPMEHLHNLTKEAGDVTRELTAALCGDGDFDAVEAVRVKKELRELIAAAEAAIELCDLAQARRSLPALKAVRP